MLYQTLIRLFSRQCSLISEAKGRELCTENRFAAENTFLINVRIIESVSLSGGGGGGVFFFILGVNTVLFDSARETRRY